MHIITPPLLKTAANIVAIFFTTEPGPWPGWPTRWYEKILEKVRRLRTVHACIAALRYGRTDRQTDRQTDKGFASS